MKWLIFAQALQEEKANRTEIFFSSNKCDSDKIILNKNEKSLIDILEKIPKIPLCIFTGKSKEELSGISYNTEILHEEDVKVNKFVKKHGWRNDFMLLCIIYKNILDFDANSIEVVRVNDR